MPQQGDKVLIPAFFINEVQQEGGAALSNVTIADGVGLNTIQLPSSHVISKLKVVPVTGVSIQSGDIEIQFDAAVWGS